MPTLLKVRSTAPRPALPSGPRHGGRASTSNSVLLAVAAGAGLLALLPAPAARAFSETAPTPPASTPAPTGPTSPAVAPRPASPTAPRPFRKKWTQADLEALRNQPGARINILDTSGAASDDSFRTYVPPPAYQPLDSNVVDRYQEMVAGAQATLDRLARERAAATNPYLRGLARDAQGNPMAPRDVAAIDADVTRWQGRRAAAQDALNQTVKAAGKRPEDYAPPPVATPGKK